MTVFGLDRLRRTKCWSYPWRDSSLLALRGLVSCLYQMRFAKVAPPYSLLSSLIISLEKADTEVKDAGLISAAQRIRQFASSSAQAPAPALSLSTLFLKH